MVLNTDGGARGNPGPSAAGIVLHDNEGNVLLEQGKYLGIGTNNEAEYQAIIFGLETAYKTNPNDSLTCVLDSELVVNQLKGSYKVKNARLTVLYKKAKETEAKLKKVEYKHVLRTQNKEADAIVNNVLDSQENE